MNKKDIFQKLEKLGLDKNRYIVISGASLVVHDIIDSTGDIDLSCDVDYYNSINWDTKKGFFGVEIKYIDDFEISYNLYDPYNVDIINGYKFMNLYACLDLKLKCNRKKDEEVIKILKNKLSIL